MAANDKDTIYIDIDDEITGIIDKLHGSDGKVVALVLPKRAAVFQSIVNMKLLKRAADSSKKNLVLITSEAGLLPLAGVAGIHVAKTLTSKPEIPLAPKMGDDKEETITEDGEPDVTAATAGDKPVGVLAGAAAGAAIAGGPPSDADAVETLQMTDDDIPASAAAAASSKNFDPPAKKKKDKKLKIPDFDRFRVLLVAGILLLIALIVGIIFAVKVLPKATIVIDTDAQNVDTNLSLTLSTTAKTLDPDTSTIPAKLVQQQKTYTQQSATTGQKNNGNKASGTISLTNCSKQDGDVTIPAGSSFIASGNTFVTQKSVTVTESTFNGSGKCNSHASASVDILAQSPGTAFNNANSFSGGNPFGGITGTGTTSGGTDSIVQSVNQNDINGAKAKINLDDATVKQTLEDQLKKDGYYPILATYTAGTPIVTTSANVGDVANTVTVTEAVTYTMFGVKESDLKTLVDNSVKTQIDTGKQSILSEGLDKATFNVDTMSATGAKVTMDTVATAGPDIDVRSIQNAAAGQKAGKIKADLENNPGIKSVDVNLSPFWVSSVPKKTEKIKVIIAEPKTTASKSNANNP